jgi:hypothetical protein
MYLNNLIVLHVSYNHQFRDSASFLKMTSRWITFTYRIRNPKSMQQFKYQCIMLNKVPYK